MGNKKVLIVGANFNNKGAQSMLFITTDELKKRLPGCEVYYAGVEDLSKENFTFKKVFYSRNATQIALGGFNGFFCAVKSFVKDCGKVVFNKKNNRWCSLDAKKLFSELDLIVDVSGFSLGKKWGVKTQETYLRNIRLAKKYNVDMFVMPQSFGPFDYPESIEYLKKDIAELLKYPKIVFAREKEGCDMLVSEFNLTNVRLSTDLVLQNSKIDPKNIYTKVPEMQLPEVKKNSVAIIPNNRCFQHGNEAAILDIYKKMIKELTGMKKNVYLVRHSSEDSVSCEKIYSSIDDNSNVTVVDRDFTCLEYDEYIKNFDFIVCSRYHGIVHAYRNYVPCILLGWAIKYKELAAHVGQSDYSFDITDPDCSAERIVEKVTLLDSRLDSEKETIKTRVKDIQKDNCFNCVSEWARAKE